MKLLVLAWPSLGCCSHLHMHRFSPLPLLTSSPTFSDKLEKKALKFGRKSSYRFLMGRLISIAVVDNYLIAPQKIKVELPYDQKPFSSLYIMCKENEIIMP